MNFDLSERIKELRVAKNLTQAGLARRLHLSASAVSSYEASYRQPSYDILVRMARFFNVSADYLLGINDKDIIDITELNENQRHIIREIVMEFKNNTNTECK